jgi:hypothetical protein
MLTWVTKKINFALSLWYWIKPASKQILNQYLLIYAMKSEMYKLIKVKLVQEK